MSRKLSCVYISFFVCRHVGLYSHCWWAIFWTHNKYHNTHATWFRKHSAFTRWWKHQSGSIEQRWCVESEVGPPLEKASPRKRRAKGAKGALGLISKGATVNVPSSEVPGIPTQCIFEDDVSFIQGRIYVNSLEGIEICLNSLWTMSKATPVFGGLSYHSTQRWGFALYHQS